MPKSARRGAKFVARLQVDGMAGTHKKGGHLGRLFSPTALAQQAR